MVTEEEFENGAGYKPEDDDMERVNCKQAGQIGHYCCGWCAKHNKPMFICSCALNICCSYIDNNNDPCH